MFKKKKGFTLAEVMVALTLIGVISVLTVPALLTNTNVKKKAMAYKKAQLTLNDAFVNGNTDGNATNTTLQLLNALTPHMGVKTYYNNNNAVQSTHGSPGTNTVSNWVITNDGIGYRFNKLVAAAGCANKIVDINFSNAPETDTTNEGRNRACYRVLVDIDGPRKGENAPAVVTVDNNTHKVTAITGDRFYIYVGVDGIATGNPGNVEGAKILDAED